jgi:hypothetical protein
MAVSKPIVVSVKAMSLSIVLGNVTTFSPFSISPQRVLVRTAAAQTNQRVELVALVSARDHIPHITYPSIDFHPMRLIAPRAEQRTRLR